MNKAVSLQMSDIVSFLKEIPSLLDKPTWAAIAVSAGLMGILFLLFHFRSIRREHSLRSEIRQYLGTNHTLSVAEHTVVDRLTSKVEELEKRAAGLEHDIRVIVDHLQNEQKRAQQTARPSRAA